MEAETDLPGITLDKNASTLPENDRRGLKFAPPEFRVKIFEHCFGEEKTVSVNSAEFPPLLQVLKKEDPLL